MVAGMVPVRWPQILQGFALLAAALVLAGCGTVAPNAAPVVSASAVPAGIVLAPPPPPSPVETPAPIKPAAPPRPAEAVPRADRIAPGHPNRPYAIRGELYVPENSDVPMREVGVASWYGEPFHGRIAASGERYDMNAMTAAHPTMPLPSYARVRNLANGREVVVRVNDRGPFRANRIIDLSRAAARKLGFTGTTMVEVERLTHEDIRSGAWRSKPATSIAQKAPAPRAKAVAPRSLSGQTLAAN
jgi:rare lipoprotein A